MATPTLLETRSFIIQRLPSDDPDELFMQACKEYDYLKIEQDPEGNIHVMSPSGTKTGNRNSKITAALTNWAIADGRGDAFDSNTGFHLPDGSTLSPDASWVSHERLQTLSPEEQEGIAHLVPEFVIELLSPSDNLRKLQRKMVDYRNNGVSLGWLIDPFSHTLYVYDQHNARTHRDLDLALGEGPVEGFELDLQKIW